MNEIANGAAGFASIGFTVALVIVALIAWFFINRVSVKATRQVRLLEALLEEQKQQNVLLRRLADAMDDSNKVPGGTQDDNNDFIRLIPER